MKKYIQLIVLCVVFSLCGCEKHDDVLPDRWIKISDCSITGIHAAVRLTFYVPQYDKDGGSIGVCYSSSETLPTIADGHIEKACKNLDSEFSIDLPLSNTVYYFRPYFTDGDDYIYGEVVKAKTTETPSSSKIRITESMLSGSFAYIYVAYSGQWYSGMQCGVCCSSTTSSPTINNCYAKSSISGQEGGTGIYNLQSSTTYYFRPYVTNGYDEVYGTVVTLTTLAPPAPGPKEFWLQEIHGTWNITSTKTKTGYNIFRSTGSYHVANGYDLLKVSFQGPASFTVYYGSYAESTYDFICLSSLDDSKGASWNNTNFSGTSVYTTSGSQSSAAPNLSRYYSTSASGTHYFYVMYKKDGTTDSNDDRGYLALPNSYNYVWKY